MNLRGGIGWLSTSAAEITRARGVIDALKKPGVIDELGFLMLNGAFAERFYPGVTTIMTRARYLVFIPAIYQHLEQSRKAIGKDVDKVSRDLQFDLRNALAKNEEHYIGREGGRLLIRVPSAVYWSALESLEIARRKISEAAYQRHLSEGAFGHSVHKDDDGAVHDDVNESLWDPTLKLNHVMQGGVFPENTSFKLRRSEALSLEERYRRLTSSGHENLVSRMIGLGREHGASFLEGIDYPWDIPGCHQEVQRHLRHARLLSSLARGATLHYYAMLLEKKEEDDSRLVRQFAKWWGQARPDLSRWDLVEFFGLMAGWGAGRGKKDQTFLTDWIARLKVVPTPEELLADRDARRTIASREDAVRSGKQRLRVKHQLDSWGLPNDFSAGFFYLNYRHSVGCRVARDIVDGLGRES